MKAVLFDLDNTLYPAEKDLFSLIDVRINHYMEMQVGIAQQEVDGLRRQYWKDYGTTLQGLMRHHKVDPEDYLSYVHEVDVGSRLSTDDELRRSIEALQMPSYVFTNGSRCHVDRVLTALGLEGVFADIFDIRVADYRPKPSPDPYLQILRQLGVTGTDCVMVEDQPQNLKTAKDLGMKTVLVGAHCKNDYSFVDAKLACPAQLDTLLPSWSR